MFVGYQRDLPVFMTTTKEELLEVLGYSWLSKIVEVAEANMVEGNIIHSEILNEEILQNEEEEIN